MDKMIEAILRFAVAIGSLAAAITLLANLGIRILDNYREATV